MSVMDFGIDFSGRPVIDLFVSPNSGWLAATQEPDASPNRLRVRALIDSGASRTFLDKSVLDDLNIDASGEAEYFSASSGSHALPAQTYLIHVFLQNVAGPCIAADLEVIGAEDLSGLKVEMLLGRDVLEHCRLYYNGPARKLKIAFSVQSSGIGSADLLH